MLQLAIVVPTLNEKENVAVLLPRLQAALDGIHWEVLFVDDDSSDGTTSAVRDLALQDPRVRIVHRIGRRGLSSACIEGMLATAAPYIAVMDADLQHDEKLLPAMFCKLRSENLDLVVASRYMQGGSLGEFSRRRRLASKLGGWVSHRLLGVHLSDPMSGFFVISRDFLESVAHRLAGIGFKILLDLIASSRTPVRFAEMPYTFGARIHGTSKLDINVAIQYAILVAGKMTNDAVPVTFLSFAIVGGFGVLIHLAVLAALHQGAGATFFTSQAIAVVVAMCSNFVVNNYVTYAHIRLRGRRLVTGFIWFVIVCSIGAAANFALAKELFDMGVPWYLAGFGGTLVAAVWNYSVSAALTWRTHKPVLG